MKFIKNFKTYVSEGAFYNKDSGSISLNWKNDQNNELEILKTNVFNDTTGFNKKGGKNSFRVFYGLEVDENKIAELNNKPIIKLTMDALKNSIIKGGAGSLIEFVRPTVSKIKSYIGNIDYIVPMGSTALLSNDLALAVQKSSPSSTIVPLKKDTFKNIVNAIDWKYIEYYEAGVGNIQNSKPRKSLLNNLKQIILKEINLDNSSWFAINAIKNSKNWQILRGILLRSDPIHRNFKEDFKIEWKSNPFNIRSSGKSFGGSRKMFKTKYQTPHREKEDSSRKHGDLYFVEAVKNCIFYKKTMLIVDDNTRTKEDISKIFDSIIEIADEMSLEKGERVDSTYHKRIMAYVLMFIPDKGTKKISLANKELVDDLKNRTHKLKQNDPRNVVDFKRYEKEYEETRDKEDELDLDYFDIDESLGEPETYTIDSRPNHIYRIGWNNKWQFQRKEAKNKNIWYWVENKDSVNKLNKKYDKKLVVHNEDDTKLPLVSQSDKNNYKMAKIYLQNDLERNKVIDAINQNAKKLGMSKNAIAALLGNVGRENGFIWKKIASPHIDPKNKATNFGIISWQGSRRDKILKRLKDKKLLDKGGKVIGSIYGVTGEMVRFIKDEMKEEVFNKLMSPSISTLDASKIFKNYIKYSMGKYNKPDKHFHAWKNHMWASALKEDGSIDYTYS
jgi:hypothetical protein